MARLTITLPDRLHRALKETSARRSQTIGEIIAESLEFYGVKSSADVAELIAKAQRHAGMSERDAMRLAVRETRAVRRSQRR